MEHTENSSPAPTSSAPATSTSDPKTLAILAWLFAPITSFMWKDHKDEFVRNHARESLHFGVAAILISLVVFALNICYGITIGFVFTGALFGIASLISCVWSLVWLALGLAILVPRIVGMVKANNMEEWSVPYVNEFMKRFIKL